MSYDQSDYDSGKRNVIVIVCLLIVHIFKLISSKSKNIVV